MVPDSRGGLHYVDGIKIYPAGMTPYGNDIIGAHAKNHRANVVISLIDVWVMKDTAKSVAPAVWLPLAAHRSRAGAAKVLDALDGVYSADLCQVGPSAVEAAGVDNVYVPHGIEPDVYKIMDADPVARFRRDVLMNPEHLTMMVAANKGYPDRKGFQFQLRLGRVRQRQTGARLYIHTEPTTMYGGIDFAGCSRIWVSKTRSFSRPLQLLPGLPCRVHGDALQRRMCSSARRCRRASAFR